MDGRQHAPQIADHVFCLRGRDGVALWYAFVDGSVVKATWDNRGAALAGLATERRRAKSRLQLHDREK